MKRFALLLLPALLSPTMARASTKVLLLEDIGAPTARFSWNRVYGGGVKFSAIVYRSVCWNQDCYDVYTTGTLNSFKRASRDVYYVGDGDRTPVLCGKTEGFFARPRFYDTCRVRVEPERVCEAWYSHDDCVETATRYRVYLEIGDLKTRERTEAPP